MGASVGKAILATSGVVANASAVATLAAALNRTNYLAGFEVTGGGATAGSLVAVTVTGLDGGPITYIYAAATGVTVGSTPLIVAFDPPLPASGPNTAIVVTVPAVGPGNTSTVANARGFQTPPV